MFNQYQSAYNMESLAKPQYKILSIYNSSILTTQKICITIIYGEIQIDAVADA